MQIRKQQLELDMEQQTGLYIVTLLIFNLYAEYIMRNDGLEEEQAGIKIPGRNINNLRQRIKKQKHNCRQRSV